MEGKWVIKNISETQEVGKEIVKRLEENKNNIYLIDNTDGSIIGLDEVAYVLLKNYYKNKHIVNK